MTLKARLVARVAGTPLAAAVLGLALFTIVPGRAAEPAERYYRDNLTVVTAPPDKYVIEVPQAAAMHGGYFKVTTDDGGRIIRIIFLVDGKVASDTAYTYAGGAKLPSESQSYKQGTPTGTAKFTRDASGRTIRIDYLTAQGSPTGYTETKYVAGHAESTNYTPDGHRRWHRERYFNADGVMIKQATQSEGSTARRETTYDPQRGLEKSSAQFRDDQLQVSIVSAYNDDDDLVRQDLYNAKGTWYGAKIYERNLLVKELYKFTDGGTAEVSIKYDANRWIERARFTHNDRLICNFVHEHLPDGTTKRTIALGPDGSLWAEYPNLSVVEVDRNGHPPNSTAGIIHKTGNWW
ncbi:MAG TPA: hypothetical protein VFW22_13790 [Pseudolabrys sp.]|nr:hypothetical protein [Pseudolabrys sp.]